MEEIPRTILKTLPPYLPAILIFLGYQIWHYLHTQWIGFHTDSPWSPSFQMVSSPKAVLYNAGLYAWRLLDYAMVILYIAIAYLWCKSSNHKNNSLLILLVLLVIALGFITVPFSGLINHRYYLPIQLLVILWFLQLSMSQSLPRVLAVLILMAAGNCIIYPDRIAQGWDSTLAHIPFYSIEKQIHNYIKDQPQITLKDIGTAYPLKVSRHLLDPSVIETGYHEYDMSSDKYILYSNIMNDFTDEELDLLAKWKKVKSIERFGVRMTLYGRP